LVIECSGGRLMFTFCRRNKLKSEAYGMETIVCSMNS
jgi:hypothetical protein